MKEVKRYAAITASGIGAVKIVPSDNGKLVQYVRKALPGAISR